LLTAKSAVMVQYNIHVLCGLIPIGSHQNLGWLQSTTLFILWWY
jgi:hypothetical protein